ncbi:Guanylyl cyclase inhibitory protein [Nibea albiflora]|uniref:Guanylyl cyclase inhibitory protein n=1 Tax=Nibea albiflora TaxID=240163 RepID=A0ACB7FEF1_NIBAL|nr:Guanylyl cyclase inhibitory protein [Nibea albiflora]
MGQAATLPCRRGETYVTELYEWFRKFINECPSGLITLHEFQRHFCNGTVGSESAEYAEQIFRTLDNNGAVYKMSVAAALTKPNPLTAEECTNRIFVRLDKDNNAIISLEEFIEGALDDDWIREMLECDPSTVKVERPLRRDTVLGTHG